jgi:Domain of unknown function (DUF4440)
MTNNHAADEVQQIMREISSAWRSDRVGDLDNYFDEDIVIKGPGMRELGRGKKACMESYADFLRQAKIKDYEESDLVIDLWENMAIATYAWKMSYELEGKEYKESGHDTFAFTQTNGKWIAVWRLMLPEPANQG